MMRKTSLLAASLSAIFTVGIASNASSQTAGALPRAAELPASTRAMALGDAYMMDANHADALFYHPSLLTGASGFGLDFQRWSTKSSSMTASAAMPWFGGGVGIGLQNLQYGAPAPGAAAAPGGQDHLYTLGSTPVSERVASIGYARQVFGIDVGVATKFVEERVGSARDATALFDVGVSTDVGAFTMGLTYQNIGQDLSVGGSDFSRPDRLTLGVGAYGQQVGIFDFGITAAVSYVDDEAIPSGGLELGYWPIQGRTFVARVGARRVVTGDASPLSVGFAYWGDDVTLEWAFQPMDVTGASGTHRFGVRWR
ncbi:MAG: hypothetical protein O2992_05955 [Gemmatimonadetes bacterium]|nr:hypothetical protein [Gemmatimonadota bacterium]